MGTTTDRGNTKKAVTTTTQMFRGLLDILHQNRSDLHQTLNTHIRSFDRKTNEEELDLGVTGFWSLMLELVFNCYTQTVLAVGITLVLLLSLITYPVKFLTGLLSNTFFRQTRPLTEDELRMYHTQQQAFNDAVGIGKKDPVPDTERKEPGIEDDGKVVRRVVYEETKVKK
jgi:hypothetical protein